MSGAIFPQFGARRGLMLVLSSPSGAGKTTITRRILERDSNLAISISVTTRAQRPGEVDGVHYHFIGKPEFDRMVRARELLEYANVFGNWYGTPRAPVEQMLAAGRDVVADVDWQGTQQLKANFRGNMVSVFVLPPSVSVLERRLRERAQDSPEVVAARMAKASDEMSHWPEYDYVIVNDRLEDSVAFVADILKVERMRRERQVGLADFVNHLREGR
ncbi:MAG TPA: guanylate kinase [Stellaceae bacterium]|nr:guanylate kinase [Stellaceae bacterium]